MRNSNGMCPTCKAAPREVRKDGTKRSYCIECRKKYLVRRYNDGTVDKENNRQWRAANRDKIAIYQQRQNERQRQERLDAIAEGRKRKPLIDILRDVASTPKEYMACIEFPGCRNPGGYGVIQADNRQYPAHRLAWMLRHGAEWLHTDVDICHTCDNPPCINPNHLFSGSAKENIADALRKGRMNHLYAKKPWLYGKPGKGTAKLTPDEVREIRVHLAAGLSLLKVAKMYGMSTTPIHHIRTGRTWRHVL